MFVFHEPGQLIDSDLELRLATTVPTHPAKGFVPVYTFHMIHCASSQTMGTIHLRAGTTELIECFAGHLGYEVLPAYRGHHYAARSCLLVLPLAQKHGLNPLWITCNPSNTASRRTCEYIGARLIDIVDLPAESDMYQRGERQKCRYRLDY